MSLSEDQAPGEDELCKICGHLFNAHRLLGYGSPPTEGWMECPVEGCDCRRTWSLEPEVAAQVRAYAQAGTDTEGT